MGELIRFVGPALLAWAAVMVRVARHRRHQRGLTNTLGWVVLLAITVSLTVKATAVYDGISALTGIPNVARLIDHTCILIAGTGAVGILAHVNGPQDVRRKLVPQVIWIAVAFTGMCVLFAVADTPVTDARFAGRYATTPGVLEYWLVYVAGMLPGFVTGARLAARYAALSTDRAIRLGLRLIAAGMLLSVVYHLHKAVFFATRRFDLPYPSVISDPLDRYLTLVSAILVLVGVTLPNWRVPAPIGDYLTHLRLRPLWLALYRIDPRIAFVPPRSLLRELVDFRDVDLRLYRRVVEIRDGRLALRAHFDPRIAAAARASAPAGLSDQKLDALVEATTLAAAMRSAAAGAAPPTDGAPVPVPGGRDLDSDIAFLQDVALAYRTLSPA
jgi:hypothetical protein